MQSVYKKYSGLWQVEQTFYITKGAPELRPMFNFTKNALRRTFAFALSHTKSIKNLNEYSKKQHQLECR
jgi:hypothetical protein